jgi:AP-1 complex subunit gamma-1
MLKKVPDMVDQFIPKGKALLGERNHAVLLTGMSLVSTICELSSDGLREFRTVRYY